MKWRRAQSRQRLMRRSLSRGEKMSVAVVGAGPAGLMAAEVLVAGGVPVTVYERMPSAARKFLLAGRGGLNLTHSEDFERFLSHYAAVAPHLRAALEAFPPAELRAWSESLGQKTFVGSSGRIFPRAMKASPLLRAWLARLRESGVIFRLRHRWVGWDADGALVLEAPQGAVREQHDAVVLALGGASWPKLGSDGSWVDILAGRGVAVAPLLSANCGFMAAWSPVFADRFQGQPLKSVEFSFQGVRVRGEAIVTRAGLEGGAVYMLSPTLRDAILRKNEAVLRLDLRPDMEMEKLAHALAAPRGKQSLASFLRKAAKLSPVGIGLLHEAAIGRSVRLAELSPDKLAALIKGLPVRVIGTAPIERAISSAGGIPFAEIDDGWMLRKLPGTFVAGEMVDWEAPTGGYLLQACFATGAAAGRGVLAWLRARDG